MNKVYQGIPYSVISHGGYVSTLVYGHSRDVQTVSVITRGGLLYTVKDGDAIIGKDIDDLAQQLIERMVKL